MSEGTGGIGRIVRGLFRATAALLSITVLVMTGYGWSVHRAASTGIVTSDVLRGAVPRGLDPRGLDEPFTALLVGLDSRTDALGDPLPPKLLAELRAGADEGQLHTDTIILLHVPAGPEARAVAISFPRDSFVQIAGQRGQHKINSAYQRGLADAAESLSAQGLTGSALERFTREAGRRSLVATVQNLAGVTVDHFAEINLAGFVDVTEALGGVPVCLNEAVREPLSGIDLPAGSQVVRGGDALAFVRQRHGLDDGDFDRVARQQAFLAGLTSTALSSGTLSDPVRVNRLVRAVTRYVVLDHGWDLANLVAQLRRMSGGNITFQTIPTGDPALRTPVDGVAVEVDPVRVRQFVRGVVNGTRSTDIAALRPSTSPTTTAQRGRVAPAATTGGEPGRSTRSAEPAESTQPPEPIRSAHPTEPTRSSHRTEPDRSAHPGEPVESGRSAKPTSAPAPTITAGTVPCVD
ncbi:MAG: LCP family protein [Pseudonocardia sp.]